MIIPYGHSGLKLFRVPWASIVLAVLCVLVFGLTNRASNRATETWFELFTAIDEAYTTNPTLEIDPAILEQILRARGVDENAREVFLESLAAQAERNPRDGASTTQKELDRLTEEYWTAYRSAPSYRFGVVPDSVTPWGLITYQFLHGGWGHLAGNLLFLLIAAPHLEQRWGLPLFIGLYLSAGIAAALAWAFRYPGLDIPLVGASGSIAGLMGAFLICYGTSKLKFFYWFAIVWGTFEAPAWLVLPLWLAIEVVSGRQMDVMFQGLGGGGVAHWAHVWGFIFGMVVAWGLSLFGLDQRLAERELAGSPAAQADHRPPILRHWPAPASRPVAAAPPEPAQPIDETPQDRGPQEMPAPPPASDTGTMKPIDGEESPIEIRPAERLKVVEGVPLAIEDPALRFTVGNDSRQLDLRRVEAVAVGAIAPPEGRPSLVVDLLLDPPSDGTCDLRVLRLRSSSFDPRKIVGGEQTMAAFIHMLERLLAASSAIPLPDAQILTAPGSTTYPSVDEYEETVLGIVR